MWHLLEKAVLLCTTDTVRRLRGPTNPTPHLPPRPPRRIYVQGIYIYIYIHKYSCVCWRCWMRWGCRFRILQGSIATVKETALSFLLPAGWASGYPAAAISLLSLFYRSRMHHQSRRFPLNSPPPSDPPLSGPSLTATFSSSVSPPAPYKFSLSLNASSIAFLLDNLYLNFYSVDFGFNMNFFPLIWTVGCYKLVEGYCNYCSFHLNWRLLSALFTCTNVLNSS